MSKQNGIISWNNYGLITELAYRLKDKRSQFSKTALQKLIFLLQELFGIKCDYRFDFYIYGPYCPDIEIDLSLVESWGGIKILPVDYGYNITIGENNEAIRAKARDFLSRTEVRDAIENLVTEFGNLKARELELLATIVYITREKKSISKDDILKIVKSLKPKFTSEEIMQSINKLQEKHYITLH